VDEYGELQKNFNLMAAELKSNEYLRKDFISSVSHQMKTPLSIIRGYANLLCDDQISEQERHEYARLIVGESERLSELTSNMLRLARIEHQEILPRQKQFSLDEQIRQAVLLLEPRWSEKQQELEQLYAMAIPRDAGQDASESAGKTYVDSWLVARGTW
jgi:signal transduction histidine kinase